MCDLDRRTFLKTASGAALLADQAVLERTLGVTLHHGAEGPRPA